MINNKIYYALLSLSLLSAVGCSKDAQLPIEPTTTTPQSAVIVGSPEGALSGEILVKFNPSASESLDSAIAPLTKSGRVIMSRSGISSVDLQLESIAASMMERVFPIATKSEALTRANDLHLWYVIHFDESQDLASVGKLLASLPEVDKVEYSRNIRPTFDRNRKSSGYSAPTTLNSKSAAGFNDPMFAQQWNLKNDGTLPEKNSLAGADINVEAAWELTTGNPEIIVAVLDEGVMYNHPDLIDNMWVNPLEEVGSTTDADGNGYAGDRHGYNFVANRGIITYDKAGDTGHGTHVAGMVAAVNNNGEGISGVAGGSGLGDGVRIMVCQIIDGYSIVTTYQEAQAIKYATDNGAVVLQCSWGINSGAASYPTQAGYSSDEDWITGSALEKEALDYFVNNAGSASGVIDGGIAIFAGGNEYAPMAGYPSRYSDYISVGALSADYTPSSFTNYDSRIAVSAPGGDTDYHLNENGGILSTMPPLADNGYALYGFMDGTSMACPQVSGVVALGLSRALDLRKHFKAEAFMELIKQSTRPIDSYFTGSKSYSLYYLDAGDKNVQKVTLDRYVGKMGGMIDAKLMVDLVGGESVGAAMRIPNYTLAADQIREDNLASYFVGGESMSFDLVVADSSIVEASIIGTTLSLEAKANGSTTIKITSDQGVDQTITVIVRYGSNGWL